MASFTLTIACDNAAFEEYPASEIARILRDAAAFMGQNDVSDGSCSSIRLRDVNGNTVGHAKYTA